jgi:hypothetical protein
MNMNKKKLLFLIALITGLSLCPLLSNVEKDIKGKVIGQLLDPVTGEPVNEAFYINIFDSKIKEFPASLFRWGIQTDDQGKFELQLEPYIYYLQFYPVSPKSKYCRTRYPYYLEEKDRNIIKVEAGKITYFAKKIDIGGILKLFIADMNNVRFNPQEKFSQKFNISCYFHNDFYVGGLGKVNDLNDGEQTVYGLYEGTYRIQIGFEGLGFKDYKKDNIVVESGKTTEVNINLDLADITGIEGEVTDAAGVPVEDADISLAAIGVSSDETIGYDAFTNKNGYYRLTGIPEGKYYITYYYTTEEIRLISIDYGYLEIKKNVLLKLDLQLKKTIGEMENK